MIRTIIWLITVVILLILTLPFLIVARLIQGQDKYKAAPGFVYDFIVGVLVRFALWLGGCEPEIRGLDNIPDGPVLFAGNHQGYCEIVMLLVTLRPLPCIVAKKELLKIPVIASWMKLFRVVFMDRSSLRAGLKCIEDQQDQLQHGNSALIFPEGTRSKGPNMGQFRNGAFKSAIKANVPVVPFAVEGTYKVFEERKRLTMAHCIISFLPPVMPAEDETTASLSDKVKAKIQAELDSIRAEKDE